MKPEQIIEKAARDIESLSRTYKALDKQVGSLIQGLPKEKKEAMIKIRSKITEGMNARDSSKLQDLMAEIQNLQKDAR